MSGTGFYQLEVQSYGEITVVLPLLSCQNKNKSSLVPSILTSYFSLFYEFLIIISSLLIILFSLSMNEVHADDKPVIAFADKNGNVVMGLWDIKIEIFRNGKVHYFGKGQAVYVQGDRYTHISQAKLKKLIKTFINAQFFEMELSISTLWSRWHPPLLTPPVILYRNRQTPPTITFNYRGRKRTIEMEGGKTIYALEESIFRAVNLKQWVCFPPSDETHKDCNFWYNK